MMASKGFFIFLVLGILSAVTPASATSRAPRPLDIRIEGGAILGCLPTDEDDSVEVDAAGVTSIGEQGDHGDVIPWQIVLAAGKSPVKLRPGECLTFNYLPPGYAETHQSGELKNGWPYSFGIRSAKVGKYGTRNHKGVFCMENMKDGLRVVQIPHTPAEITSATCRRLLDSSTAMEHEP